MFRFSFRYVTWKISCRAFSTASGANFQLCLVWFRFFCYFEYRKANKTQQQQQQHNVLQTRHTKFHLRVSRFVFAGAGVDIKMRTSLEWTRQPERGEKEKGRGDMLSYNTRPNTHTHTHTTVHIVVPACPTSSAHKCLLAFLVVVK